MTDTGIGQLTPLKINLETQNFAYNNILSQGSKKWNAHKYLEHCQKYVATYYTFGPSIHSLHLYIRSIYTFAPSIHLLHLYIRSIYTFAPSANQLYLITSVSKISKVSPYVKKNINIKTQNCKKAKKS